MTTRPRNSHRRQKNKGAILNQYGSFIFVSVLEKNSNLGPLAIYGQPLLLCKVNFSYFEWAK